MLTVWIAWTATAINVGLCVYNCVSVWRTSARFNQTLVLNRVLFGLCISAARRQMWPLLRMWEQTRDVPVEPEPVPIKRRFWLF